MPGIYDMDDPIDLACSYFDCDTKKVDTKLAALADKVVELKKSEYYEKENVEEWAKRFSEEIAKFND